MKYILVNQQDRGKLSEGRQQGMGFAFASGQSDGGTVTLTTVDPISSCKDYLSDRCATELTGKTYTYHGLTTTKLGLFDCGVAYLIMSICPRGAKTLTPYDKMASDIAALDANHKTIQSFVNWFEAEFKVDGRTSIERVDSNQYVVIAPLFWTRGTYLISLLGLLLRSALRYTGTPDPISYLKTLESDDKYHLTTVLPKIERMRKGDIPVQVIKDEDHVHSLGIVSYRFPSEGKPEVKTVDVAFDLALAKAAVVQPKSKPAAPIVELIKEMKRKKKVVETKVVISA